MDAVPKAFLDELYRDGLDHDAALADRLRRRRNLEPDAAALLAVMITAVGARSMVEIGTSNGYSTIWFAAALRAHGGHLLTVDLDVDVQAEAEENLRRSGVVGDVEFRTEDGGAVLAGLPEGSVDVLFLDSERPEYVGWWPHPRRVLRPGGLLVVDNVLSHPDEVADFSALVEADPAFTSTVVAVGKGELMAVTTPA